MNVAFVVAVLLMITIWIFLWQWVIVPTLILGLGILIGVCIREILNMLLDWLAHVG
jgi:hypothetical protein